MGYSVSRPVCIPVQEFWPIRASRMKIAYNLSILQWHMPDRRYYIVQYIFNVHLYVDGDGLLSISKARDTDYGFSRYHIFWNPLRAVAKIYLIFLPLRHHAQLIHRQFVNRVAVWPMLTVFCFNMYVEFELCRIWKLYMKLEIRGCFR